MSDDLAPVRIYTGELNEALRKMVAQSKQELADLLRNEVARPLLRKIIAITPPNKGAAGMAGKRAGAGAIKTDYRAALREFDDTAIRRLAHMGYATSHIDNRGSRELQFQERMKRYAAGRNAAALDAIFRCLKVPRTFLPSLDPAFVKSLRDKQSGRMRPDARFFTAPTAVKQARTAAQKHVGALAAGWNPSAKALAVSVPEWIGQGHGNQGHILLELEGEHLRIVLSNDSTYGDSVRGFRQRVQTAVDWQARDMHRRIDDFAQKNVRI